MCFLVQHKKTRYAWRNIFDHRRCSLKGLIRYTLSLLIGTIVLSACASSKTASPEETADEIEISSSMTGSAQSKSVVSEQEPSLPKAEDAYESKAPLAKKEMPAQPQTKAAEERSRPTRATQTVRYLSADDSNSAASPVIARKMIRAGKYVQPAVIRTYEFLNYYSFPYPAPEQNLIRIIPQMRALDTRGEYSLQVAVRSQDRSLEDLPPFNITFLLDTSGSMAGAPIQLAEELLLGFVEKLRAGDLLSLVTCNRKPQVLLEAHRIGSNTPERLETLLRDLEVNDITDLEQGVLKAYEVANRNYNYRFLNRVILISDGADNVGTAALETISKYSEDSDRQGIYLAGIGLGEGFNDQLMDTFTDRGRGAYLFVDSPREIQRILDNFVANFDLAVKNVRLKMIMPPGWSIKEFHGEQISARAADIVPQYLSPNDQMIYHLTLSTDREPSEITEQIFEFEVEFSPLSGPKETVQMKTRVADLLSPKEEILKGDAVVEYAELLKTIRTPLQENQEENLKAFDEVFEKIKTINTRLQDVELTEMLSLLEYYRRTVKLGERFAGSRDRFSDDPDTVLGISPNVQRKVSLFGGRSDLAVRALERLGNSNRLVPQEGYRFLVLSSGPVWNPGPAGSGELSNRRYRDPMPEYMGTVKTKTKAQQVYDLYQVRLELKAPAKARSFSFDFNFFSAEYPEYVNQSYNDTFYAILEAPSTNRGRPTNIAFDSDNNSMEVDNNYFQNPFHPIPNTGTGFDAHGSTGWLRTSWPIRGGENLLLTFSIHDEGDAIYDSLVVLDNFQFHEYEAVGTTDPLN